MLKPAFAGAYCSSIVIVIASAVASARPRSCISHGAYARQIRYSYVRVAPATVRRLDGKRKNNFESAVQQSHDN